MNSDPEDLEDRIAKARISHARQGPDRTGSSPDVESTRALGAGLRIGIEFVSAIVVGCGLGLAADRWLGTGPFGLLILGLAGFVAALLRIRKVMMG